MDRTDIIRNRIADLRSEKYAYLTKYISNGENCYEYPYSDVALEWESLLDYLERKVLPEGLKYNIVEEQEDVDFVTIYTGELLGKYIDSITKPDSGADKVLGELSEYINCTAEYYNDWAPVQESICYLHDDLTRPALPVIAKYIKDQGEEELYRSALIVLDYEKILKTCIEKQDKYVEHRMYQILMDRLENLKYFGYDRIYLCNIGVMREFFIGQNLFEYLKVPYTYLGVRIVMTGCLSYFAEYIIQQNDRYADKMPYGYVLYPPRLKKYCKVSSLKDIPQLTPEETKHVEDIVLFTAREVFYTDKILIYQSFEDPWWNRLSEYDTRLKYNTSRFSSWQFPDWMVPLIEYYILYALQQSICDTQEDRERVEKYKAAVLKCLPEPFQDKAFSEDPYGDPAYDIVRSTGIVSGMSLTEPKRYVYYVPIPEVAAYYLHLDKYRPV